MLHPPFRDRASISHRILHRDLSTFLCAPLGHHILCPGHHSLCPPQQQHGSSRICNQPVSNASYYPSRDMTYAGSSISLQLLAKKATPSCTTRQQSSHNSNQHAHPENANTPHHAGVLLRRQRLVRLAHVSLRRRSTAAARALNRDLLHLGWHLGVVRPFRKCD